MSQHIIYTPVTDEPNEFGEHIVLTFGWDSHLSELFAKSHHEACFNLPDDEKVLEAIDGTLIEKCIKIKPTCLINERENTLETVRDIVHEIVSDNGIVFSTKVLATLNIICERMIEDALDSRFRQRSEIYEL